MLGRLSGNPNVLDHFIRGNCFEATYDLWTRGRPLKLPILNDHVRRQPSEVYPKSAHVRVCYFQLICLCTCQWLSMLILGLNI